MLPPSWVPQYRQIEQALRARILTMRPGERLPSDSDLCREFAVSRLHWMESEGDVRLDHVTHVAALEQSDGGFAQCVGFSAFGLRVGTKQGQPCDAFGRLSRGFHCNHSAHRGTTQD